MNLPELKAALAYNHNVRVAGVDIDGMLRGKIMSKKKFLSILSSATERTGHLDPVFGFCSVIFGWDMHDKTYSRELGVSNAANGYRDILARIDLQSFRRMPFETDGGSGSLPLFLVTFLNPDDQSPLKACPRGLLTSIIESIHQAGFKAIAGVEYEFTNFQVPSSKSALSNDQSSESVAEYLQDKDPSTLPPATEGMFGYSLLRPLQQAKYFSDILGMSKSFGCPIEGWHTESGPGVYEAALESCEIQEMADRAALFKHALADGIRHMVKAMGLRHNITPCFMAKPRQGLPGNSGHIHISLVGKDGKNAFARDCPDPHPQYPDLAHVSDLGRWFLAGLLDGLPDIMSILAPTINSYKRLVENFWAPVTVSWGLEHRAASIRLIAPPTASSQATRFEIRVPGADTNPHLVLAAILALGYRGIEKKLSLKIPPLGKSSTSGQPGADTDYKTNLRLPISLREATTLMMRPNSVARQALSDEFVDHFGGTREHELRLWDEAVTDWEFRRYIETV